MRKFLSKCLAARHSSNPCESQFVSIDPTFYKIIIVFSVLLHLHFNDCAKEQKVTFPALLLCSYLYIYFPPLPMNNISTLAQRRAGCWHANPSLFWLAGAFERKRQIKHLTGVFIKTPDSVETPRVAEKQHGVVGNEPPWFLLRSGAKSEGKTWHFISPSHIRPTSHSSARQTELRRGTGMMKNSMTLIWHLQLLLLLLLPLFFFGPVNCFQ